MSPRNITTACTGRAISEPLIFHDIARRLSPALDYLNLELSMTNIAKSGLVILALAVVATTYAQEPATKQDKVNVYRKYDKNKQETITGTELMLVYGPAGPYSLGFGLSTRAAYVFPGRTPSPPEDITLTFMSSEDSYVFTFERDLTIRADGEVFQLGKMEYSQIEKTLRAAYEKLWISIPRDVFARIANSKKVHVKLGQKEFDFTEKHLKHFQALISSIGR